MFDCVCSRVISFFLFFYRRDQVYGPGRLALCGALCKPHVPRRIDLSLEASTSSVPSRAMRWTVKWRPPRPHIDTRTAPDREAALIALNRATLQHHKRGSEALMWDIKVKNKIIKNVQLV